MSSEVLWSNQLDTLRRRLPDGVRLSTLTVTPTRRDGTGCCRLDGRAASGRRRAAPARAPLDRLAGTTTASSNYIASVSMSGVALSTTTQWPPSSRRLAAMPGWGNVYLTNTTAGSRHRSA